MVELVKRYKVILVISFLLILNVGMIFFQLQSAREVELIKEEEKQELLLSSDEEAHIDNQEIQMAQEEPTSYMPSIAPSVNVLPTPTEPQSIPVYICGAVHIPGVYYVKRDAIINDLILLCGGLTEEADATAINLASPIVANEKIVVPKQGEQLIVQNESREYVIQEENTQANHTSSPSSMQLININQAGMSELKTLPGIGEVKAAAIINYRETVHSFNTIEELKKVSGIGDKTFEKLKTLITV